MAKSFLKIIFANSIIVRKHICLKKFKKYFSHFKYLITIFFIALKKKKIVFIFEFNNKFTKSVQNQNAYPADIHNKLENPILIF
jgi:hypothetical protein